MLDTEAGRVALLVILFGDVNPALVCTLVVASILYYCYLSFLCCTMRFKCCMFLICSRRPGSAAAVVLSFHPCAALELVALLNVFFCLAEAIVIIVLLRGLSEFSAVLCGCHPLAGNIYLVVF